KVSIRPAIIREISIGGLVFKNHPCIIIDKKDLEIKLFGLIKVLKIDGIIGWNAIKQMDLRLDYRNKKVRMERPVPVDNCERNFFWLGYPVVKAATVSGRSLFFGLDTGANKSSASDSVLSKIDTADMTKKKVRTGGAGGKIETRMMKKIPKMPVVIGGNLLTFEDVHCDNAEHGSFFVLDGILGSDAAKNGVMHLDFTNGRFDLLFPEK
ncbi:MAG: retropepsin-like domain-containing protein, partial [Candidatus Aminicenantes bacterium]|nr:retropepsin-like domain-containing protein [Candidatus Aminicenantes bacterium]